MAGFFKWLKGTKKTVSRPETAYIGLGGNLGDTSDKIHKALKLLDDTNGIYVEKFSRICKTKPLGTVKQPDYYNSVARIKTKLPPQALFHRMCIIEELLGRIRNTERWSPRTIDLDLLMVGRQVINSRQLIVPHPQMHLRSFVMNGMCELDASLEHPLLKKTMQELKNRLNGGDYFLDPQRPQLISVAGVLGVGKTTLAQKLTDYYQCSLIREAYDTNPYLKEVYQGRQELALKSQIYFLQSRLQQLSLDQFSPGEVAVTDYVFDKELIYAAMTLTDVQLKQYRQEYKHVKDRVIKPVLLIYLRGAAEKCLERIRDRNREFEQQIELDTLKQFADDYDALICQWRYSPVITLDAESFDSFDGQTIKTLSKEIENYLCRQ